MDSLSRTTLPWLLVLTLAPAVAQSPSEEAVADDDASPGQEEVYAEEAVGDPGVHPLELRDESAVSWPQFRGPTRDGVATDGQYPDSWTPEGPLLWKVEVPGEDSSSPAVWGDRIFLTTNYVDETRKRSILCYRRTDGALLWETSAPPPEERFTQRKPTYAIASPVTDGKRVYAHLGSYGLMTVDFETGKELWRRTVTTFDLGTSSPLLVDDKVVVLNITSRRERSYLVAYKAATGSMAWRRVRTERISSGSPVAVRAGDRTEIVVAGPERVRAYATEKGEELWSVLGTSNNVIATPVVGYGMVFVTSARDPRTLAIHPGGDGDVTGTNVAWRNREVGSLLASPLFHDGLLYIVDESRVLTCLAAGTGEILWRARLGGQSRAGFTSSPVLVDGKIFATDDDGRTFVVKPGVEFELLGSNRIGEPVRATPALADGVWYFRTEHHLVAIGAP